MYKSKIGEYEILYPNKNEYKILKDEIFKNEIYQIHLESNSPFIIDLGSHIGLSLIYFKKTYPNSQILAFEPNPNTFPILEDNIWENSIENIELKNIAIDTTEGKKEFHIDNTGNEWFSTSGFIKNAWNGKQKSLPIEVNTEKLSKYLNKEVDLIKMDIEGNETKVIKEIEKKLHLIRNLIIEYHPTGKQKLRNLIKILKRNNFQIHYFIDGKEVNEGMEELVIIKAVKIS